MARKHTNNLDVAIAVAEADIKAIKETLVEIKESLIDIKQISMLEHARMEQKLEEHKNHDEIRFDAIDKQMIRFGGIVIGVGAVVQVILPFIINRFV